MSSVCLCVYMGLQARKADEELKLAEVMESEEGECGCCMCTCVRRGSVGAVCARV